MPPPVPSLKPVLSDMSPPPLPEPPKLKPAVKKAASMPARTKPPQPEMPQLTRAVHWQKHEDDDAYTSVHVSKEHKDVRASDLLRTHCHFDTVLLPLKCTTLCIIMN